MRVGRAAGCILSIALFVSGCIQSTHVYTLNPDGSGKMEIDALLRPPIHMVGDLDDDTDVQALAGKVARRILRGSKGVDVWGDVSFGVSEDGRVLFRGTAYFRDLSKFRLRYGGFPIGLLCPVLAPDGSGSLVLGLKPRDMKGELKGDDGRSRLGLGLGFPDEAGDRDAGDADTDGSSGEEAADEPLDEQTELEQAEAVKRGKMVYQAIRPVLDACLLTRRRELVFRLPGEVGEHAVFKKDEDGALRLVIDGSRMLGALDELVRKDAAGWRETVGDLERSDRPAEESHALINEKLFGERGRVRAVVGGGLEPLFDYAAEADACREAYRKLLKDLPARKKRRKDGSWRRIRRWKAPDDLSDGGSYPWTSVVSCGGPLAVAGKVAVPVAGLALHYVFSARNGPTYLDYPYADESAGTSFLVPELEDSNGKDNCSFLSRGSDYVVEVDELDHVAGGRRSTRFSASHVSGSGREGTRAEARMDLPGHFGFWAGAFDVDGRDRTSVRFTNAFVMNTRAVASLDLGWAEAASPSPGPGSSGDEGFEWGVDADLFPRKPWLVHMSYHKLRAGGRPSEFRLSLGAALDAFELSVGWTRLAREDAPGETDDFLEAGVRLWWSF